MVVIRKRPWEHRTRRKMQIALAGSTPRDVYEKNREAVAAELRRLFNLDGNQRGFEIGSGDGLVARLLSPHCTSLDCTDISRSFLKRARKTCRGCGNVRFHLIGHGYLESLAADHFDFGYSVNVFIHLNEYEIYHYLCDVERVLKHGGLFYLTGATIAENTIELFRHFADRYYRRRVITPGFMRWNGFDVLKPIISESGLRVVEPHSHADGGHLKILLMRPRNQLGSD